MVRPYRYGMQTLCIYRDRDRTQKPETETKPKPNKNLKPEIARKASGLIRTYVRMGVTEQMAWEVSCRLCGAAGGFPCCSKTGHVVMTPHLDRYRQAAKAMAGAA